MEGPHGHMGCMDRFKEALEDCELMDLGFEGDPFTTGDGLFDEGLRPSAKAN